MMMIPTFFIIIIFLFIIINLLPGTPSGNRSFSSSESFENFKKQFNLDKPVFLNLRFLETSENINDKLNIFSSTDKTINPLMKMKAVQYIKDSGKYSILPLISLLKNKNSKEKEILITQFLNKTVNLEKKEESLNWIILPGDNSETVKLKKEKWNLWFQSRKNELNLSLFDKLKIMFLETRFYVYFKNVIRFDFGNSITNREPVLDKILSRLKISIILSILATVFALLIAIPAGTIAAVNEYRIADKIITLIQFFLYSITTFFVATIFLTYFSKGGIWLPLFPTGGLVSENYKELGLFFKFIDLFKHLFLPVLCLSLPLISIFSKYMRNSLCSVMKSDHIRAARARGIPEWKIIINHGLVNSLIPVVTVLGSIIPFIIGGSVIIEYIFGIPGLGLLTIDAIQIRDFNMVLGIQAVTAIIVMLGVLLADFAYAIIDPRISYR